jgi:two-component system, OmpR family, sensor histidine kinase MtrB
MAWRWWRSARQILATPFVLWRASLLLRTVSVTVLLSGVAVTLIGGYMSLTIAGSLFDSRRDQVVQEMLRTLGSVQTIFDNAVTAQGTIDVETANSSAQTTIRASQSAPGAGGFAILRTPGQITPQTMTSASSAGLDTSVVTGQMRAQVVREPEQAHFQSVRITTAEGTAPALVAGGTIIVPSAGQYELYLVYDLSDVQSTLLLVQTTLVGGSILLVIMIGLVTWLVVRLAIGPVRVAASTAEKLAEGFLEERIEERGSDVIAVLARSFNRMADAMQSQIVRLATLSQVQQRFVSDVSHELRTPLTTIRLAGDVLYRQRESFEPETRRTVELLMTQIERFELMLTDLLEMSRYDAGAVSLEVDQANIVALVQDCLDQLEPIAEQKGSPLVLEVRGGYGDIEVDAGRIRRIIVNFLGNAIDHGEGRPIVTFVDSNEDAVAIAVRDYGVGMSNEQVAQVFQRFWRADPSRQRTSGGTGLGLAIAQEDAAAHGGVIDVWSREGEGSCFRLTLPRTLLGSWSESPLELAPEPDTHLPELGAVSTFGSATS